MATQENLKPKEELQEKKRRQAASIRAEQVRGAEAERRGGAMAERQRRKDQAERWRSGGEAIDRRRSKRQDKASTRRNPNRGIRAQGEEGCWAGRPDREEDHRGWGAVNPTLYANLMLQNINSTAASLSHLSNLIHMHSLELVLPNLPSSSSSS
jgi:hypothetical protein